MSGKRPPRQLRGQSIGEVMDELRDLESAEATTTEPGAAVGQLWSRHRESLVLLSEECSEVAIAVAKCLRHGFDSVNPDEPGGPTNLEAIADELGDVLASVDVLLANLGRPASVRWFRARMRGARTVKLANVEQYLHFATAPNAKENAADWGEA